MRPCPTRITLPGVLALVALLLLAGAATTVRASDDAAPDGGVHYFSYFDRWAPDPQPLDFLPRFLEPGQRLRCDTDELLTHRNRELRYAVRVHPAFSERLAAFEALLVERAVVHYGRAPRRLVHRGAFSCRKARGRRGRISEHALGNAIDLLGFDFGRLPRGVEAPVDLPRNLRRPFRVRVLTHWTARRQRDARHAAFLHDLVEALRRRPDIFRGIVGPPRPRHRDHLHLDAAPWQYAMFGYDPS